jgi:hypothetical protein
MAEDKVNSSLDSRIVLALETAPRTDVPANFAAKIARQLPARSVPELTPRRYGQRAAVACLLALPVLMLAFVPRATGTSVYWFSIESIFAAQSALLAVWVAARARNFTKSV